MKTEQLRAADIFDELPPLEEHEQKKFKVERTKTVDDLLERVECFLKDPWYPYPEVSFPKSYTARDVEMFSILLSQFDYEQHNGYVVGFINNLIYRCPDSSFIIHTRHHERRIHDLGEGNDNKHITILGDVGHSLGKCMSGGTLIVRGDAGTHVGNTMNAGTIHIYGNVEGQLGTFMKGGKIVVDGNVNTHYNAPFGGVGAYMTAGEIHINGDFDELASRLKDGTIYHKGTCIVKDGKIL